MLFAVARAITALTALKRAVCAVDAEPDATAARPRNSIAAAVPVATADPLKARMERSPAAWPVVALLEAAKARIRTRLAIADDAAVPGADIARMAWGEAAWLVMPWLSAEIPRARAATLA